MNFLNICLWCFLKNIKKQLGKEFFTHLIKFKSTNRKSDVCWLETRIFLVHFVMEVQLGNTFDRTRFNQFGTNCTDSAICISYAPEHVMYCFKRSKMTKKNYMSFSQTTKHKSIRDLKLFDRNFELSQKKKKKPKQQPNTYFSISSLHPSHRTVLLHSEVCNFKFFDKMYISQ